MRYVIYGSDNCSYCDKAKALLDAKGLAYDYHNIFNDEILLDWFSANKWNTVPQIFYGDFDHVGGYTELKGKLDEA